MGSSEVLTLCWPFHPPQNRSHFVQLSKTRPSADEPLLDGVSADAQHIGDFLVDSSWQV
jgi:hypothetical protein